MSVCLIATGDLMGYSRLSGAARAAGLEPVQVRGADAVVARLGAGDVRAILVDLGDPGGGPDAVTAAVGANARVIAIGPHVQKELLEEARRRGADDVLPHSATGEPLVRLLILAATP